MQATLNPAHDEAGTPPCPAAEPTIGRTLRQVAQYLTDHGWIQGAYYDATGGSFTPPACLVGALGMVCYGGPVAAPAQMFDDPGFGRFEAALAFLDQVLNDRFGVVAYEFNDARGRVAIEVRAALDGAADVWDRTYGGAA